VSSVYILSDSLTVLHTSICALLCINADMVMHNVPDAVRWLADGSVDNNNKRSK